MTLYGRKQINILLHDVWFHFRGRTAPMEGLRFFLAGADHERYEKAEWARRQSSYVPPWSYTVSGRCWFRIDEKKRRLWKSKPPLHGRVKMGLRYDGFFLLPSSGSFCKVLIILYDRKNLFIFFPNHIYGDKHTTKEHSHQDIFPDVLPNIRYNVPSKDVNYGQECHAQAQPNAKGFYNRRPISVIKLYSRHIHTERAIIKNIYLVFIIESW